MYSLCMCLRRCSGHRLLLNHRLLFLSQCGNRQVHSFGRSRAGDERFGWDTGVGVDLGVPDRGFACDGRCVRLLDGMARCSGTGQSPKACLEFGR
jgi:hypothetical protein